jgi:hypothetical protein
MDLISNRCTPETLLTMFFTEAPHYAMNKFTLRERDLSPMLSPYNEVSAQRMHNYIQNKDLFTDLDNGLKEGIRKVL